MSLIKQFYYTNVTLLNKHITFIGCKSKTFSSIFWSKLWI